MEDEIQRRVVQFTKTDGVYTLSGLVDVPITATSEEAEAAAQKKFNQMVARIHAGEQIGEI